MRIILKNRKGKDLKTKIKSLVLALSNSQLQRIAKETEQIMRNNIDASLVHPTYSSGNLKNNIIAEQIGTSLMPKWGIGNISLLNKEVPYWAHINYGSEGIGANWDHWLPKGRWVDGLWVEDSNGYYAKPQRPIEPHNYIERTIAEIPKIIHKNL
ncbi:MAG: hypothetical protein ACTSWG_10440 [Candidatus Helarchaeota archaeon]